MVKMFRQPVRNTNLMASILEAYPDPDTAEVIEELFTDLDYVFPDDDLFYPSRWTAGKPHEAQDTLLQRLSADDLLSMFS